MLTVFAFTLVDAQQGWHPNFGCVAFDENREAYFHPDLIGCQVRALNEEVLIFVRKNNEGFLPLVSLKWARDSFPGHKSFLDSMEENILRYAGLPTLSDSFKLLEPISCREFFWYSRGEPDSVGGLN
jgi:hypothetical protein